MGGSLLLWIALAIVTFWAVGVRNRLMRMRSHALDAFASVDKYMQQYASLMQVHVLGPCKKNAVNTTSEAVAVPQAWASLLSLLQDLGRAIPAARAAPLESLPLQRLGDAFDDMQRAWFDVCSLPIDLAGAPVPDSMQMEWDGVTLKVQAARAGFNKILCKYNESLCQFPARLVVGRMGFKVTGKL